jgi:hypothetical protein
MPVIHGVGVTDEEDWARRSVEPLARWWEDARRARRVGCEGSCHDVADGHVHLEVAGDAGTMRLDLDPVHWDVTMLGRWSAASSILKAGLLIGLLDVIAFFPRVVQPLRDSQAAGGLTLGSERRTIRAFLSFVLRGLSLVRDVVAVYAEQLSRELRSGAQGIDIVATHDPVSLSMLTLGDPRRVRAVSQTASTSLDDVTYFDKALVLATIASEIDAACTTSPDRVGSAAVYRERSRSRSWALVQGVLAVPLIGGGAIALTLAEQPGSAPALVAVGRLSGAAFLCGLVVALAAWSAVSGSRRSDVAAAFALAIGATLWAGHHTTYGAIVAAIYLAAAAWAAIRLRRFPDPLRGLTAAWWSLR